VIIRLDLADSRLLKEPGDRRKQAASIFGWAFSSESCARLDDEGAWVGLLRRDLISGFEANAAGRLKKEWFVKQK
jgi:hypothetical protein